MNAPNTAGWRPEMGAAHSGDDATFTGNRALMLEERLIFEIGDTSTTGVDIDPAPAAPARVLAKRAWLLWVLAAAALLTGAATVTALVAIQRLSEQRPGAMARH